MLNLTWSKNIILLTALSWLLCLASAFLFDAEVADRVGFDEADVKHSLVKLVENGPDEWLVYQVVATETHLMSSLTAISAKLFDQGGPSDDRLGRSYEIAAWVEDTQDFSAEAIYVVNRDRVFVSGYQPQSLSLKVSEINMSSGSRKEHKIKH